MWSSALTFLESTAAPMLNMEPAVVELEDVPAEKEAVNDAKIIRLRMSSPSLETEAVSEWPNETEALEHKSRTNIQGLDVKNNAEAHQVDDNGTIEEESGSNLPEASKTADSILEYGKSASEELMERVSESSESEEEEDEDEDEDETKTNVDGSDIAPIGWMASMVESFMESTEVTLSAAASTLREGMSETVHSVTNNLLESDFYKNNLVYIPPDDASRTHAQSSSSAPTTPSNASIASKENPKASTDPGVLSVQRHPHKERKSGFFSLEESFLSQVESAPVQDRIAAAGQSIGFLKIRVSESRRLFVDPSSKTPGTTHPYLNLRLGKYQNWTSPIAKEDVKRPGTFLFNREITLVAQDVFSDLIIEVRHKNVLVSDTLVGQILVPITSIIPCVRDALSGRHKRCEPYTLSSWFELFPLPEGKKKFRPAAHDIAKTGMWKTDVPLGYLHLDLELHLHGRVSMWAGYGLPAVEDLMDVAKPTVPTGDLKAISQVVETGRGFKRNFQRVKTAFSRLFSRGKYAWVPMRFLRRARTFEDWRVSLFVLAAAAFACLIAPPSMLPLNLYLVVLVSTVSGWKGWKDQSEPSAQESAAVRDGESNGKKKVVVTSVVEKKPDKYVVWNQDIRDPDDNLGSIQKIAKLMYLMEKFERWMGIAADVMERVIHAFSFADERVTIAALLSLGVCCFGLSLVLMFFTPGYLFYFGFMFWFLKPTLISPLLAGGGGNKKKDRSQNSRATKAMMLSSPRHSDEDLRSEGKLAQAIAVAKLMAQAPSLASNVFARVPTEDELGHRWIASLQRIKGEPPESDDEDEEEDVEDDEDQQDVSPELKKRKESPAASLPLDEPMDEIWLREL